MFGGRLGGAALRSRSTNVRRRTERATYGLDERDAQFRKTVTRHLVSRNFGRRARKNLFVVRTIFCFEAPKYRATRLRDLFVLVRVIYVRTKTFSVTAVRRKHGRRFPPSYTKSGRYARL